MNTFFNVCMGCALGMMLSILVLSCCETAFENKFYLVEEQKTFTYKEKVYRVVLDTALTDSIHEWRK